MPSRIRAQERSQLPGLFLAALASLPVLLVLCTFDRNGLKMASGTTILTTSLIDQGGEQISLDRLRGRLVLLNFVYTGCGRICPMQTEQLARVQRALPGSLQDHVRFLSISLDPANDSPETLKRFALLHGADLANWSFVTGEPVALAHLTVAYVGQSRNAPPGDHSADIRLLDSKGTVIQRYSGVPVAVGRIIDDIRQLAQSNVEVR